MINAIAYASVLVPSLAGGWWVWRYMHRKYPEPRYQ
jgi:hypothetical protein